MTSVVFGKILVHVFVSVWMQLAQREGAVSKHLRRGGFSWDGLGSWLWGMFGDSHSWVVGSSGCGWCILVLTGGSTWARSWMELITGAEKKIEHGCGKYSELKKKGEPGVEALRDKVCKALFQLEEQILSACLTSTRCRLTELHQLCQGGCESTVPGSRDVTLLSQPPDSRGGSCPVVTAAALQSLAHPCFGTPVLLSQPSVGLCL